MMAKWTQSELGQAEDQLFELRRQDPAEVRIDLICQRNALLAALKAAIPYLGPTVRPAPDHLYDQVESAVKRAEE